MTSGKSLPLSEPPVAREEWERHGLGLGSCPYKITPFTRRQITQYIEKGAKDQTGNSQKRKCKWSTEAGDARLAGEQGIAPCDPILRQADWLKL